jgi:hypothetical protein
MAASFLVAFGLGLAMPRWFPGRPGQLAPVGSSPDVTTVATNAGHEPSGVNQIRHASYKPIGNLQLVVDGPGGVSTPVGDVPVYDGQGSAAEWLNDQRPALSPEVLQTLQDRGHKIDRQIEYVPVRLEDGRDVIVPIERYQIRAEQAAVLGSEQTVGQGRFRITTKGQMRKNSWWDVVRGRASALLVSFAQSDDPPERGRHSGRCPKSGGWREYSLS